MAFVLYTCMMRAVLMASCLVISTHALVIGASGEISQPNFTDLTFGGNVHCTTDASWLVSPIEDLVVYDTACQGAMRIARQELQTFNPDTEFEFYDRASRPVTTRPKILLPRKYSVGKHPTPFTFWVYCWERESRLLLCVAGSLGRPSCTLAIAMIDALGPGAALPGQPPGSFRSSDVLKMGDLTTHWNPQNLAAPFFECVRRSVAGRRSSALGWSRVGERDPFI